MLTVKTEVPESVMVGGTKAQVGSLVPVGRMLPQDRVIVPVKPLVGVMVTVDVAEDPATTEAGERAGVDLIFTFTFD